MTHFTSPDGWTSDICQIHQLKKGDFFKIDAGESAPVWVRGEYDRSSKKYSCYRFDDVNHEHMWRGSVTVHTNFTF